jgi:hypothetical protein
MILVGVGRTGKRTAARAASMITNCEIAATISRISI